MSGLLQRIRRAWNWETIVSGWSWQRPSPARPAEMWGVLRREHSAIRNSSDCEVIVTKDKEAYVVASPGEYRTYTTLMELRESLAGLEGFGCLTVVLVLDSSFSGHLSSLIERRSKSAAARLVLTVKSGRLPGLETIGDVTVAGGALGWQEIVFEREAVAAVRDAGRTLSPNERMVVFTPSWHSNNEYRLSCVNCCAMCETKT